MAAPTGRSSGSRCRSRVGRDLRGRTTQQLAQGRHRHLVAAAHVDAAREDGSRWGLIAPEKPGRAAAGLGTVIAACPSIELPPERPLLGVDERLGVLPDRAHALLNVVWAEERSARRRSPSPMRDRRAGRPTARTTCRCPGRRRRRRTAAPHEREHGRHVERVTVVVRGAHPADRIQDVGRTVDGDETQVAAQWTRWSGRSTRRDRRASGPRDPGTPGRKGTAPRRGSSSSTSTDSLQPRRRMVRTSV